MPFVQRIIEPKYLSRTSLFDEDGTPLVNDNELIAVTNNTLSNALRQLASLVLVANDIFTELGDQFKDINKRSEEIKKKITVLEEKVARYDPKKVAVPESDISTFALLKDHYKATHTIDSNLFSVETRPTALKTLYESATKTPVHVMRQLDRWRRDGHRSSRFFLCTPVLGAKRRKIKNVDIDIETHMPSAVEELRRWTSNEALGDITVTPDGISRITSNCTAIEGEEVDANLSDSEGIDHKLPSPEEQLKVVALKFPAEVVAVDISGKSFDRMSVSRRSFLHGDIISSNDVDHSTIKRRTKSRRPRNRRRNTLAGTDHKEIENALTAGDEPAEQNEKTEETPSVCRSRSSDILRSSKKDSPEKKSHFNTLKQWGKSRYDRFMNKSGESKRDSKDDSPTDTNMYEMVSSKRTRDVDKKRTHDRNPSISSSEKSSFTIPLAMTTSNIATVKLRESASQRRRRRNGDNKDEPHSSSGNWSASSESGRASIGSEITTTPQPKSTSVTTSDNSLNLPSSVSSRRKFNVVHSSTSESVTSEGTLTPDIIHDLHEDGETSSVYSCDTEGYYTSFHMDSGLKTLKEEELPCTPLHFTSAFCNSGSNNTVLSAENEYELFGKGSTSTTTSSAGTVCTTLLAADSSKSLIIGPTVPERKSSLSNKNSSPDNTIEKDFSSKTGTIKRSPATSTKPIVVALIHKKTEGDISPDSGHNTSSSPIESINSPTGIRSSSECEYSESSDQEGSERIRVKTTINSSRIPSMCVITPPHSDDECASQTSDKRIIELNNVNQIALGSKNADRDKLDLDLKQRVEDCLTSTRIISNNNQLSLVNVNLQTGYATVENMDQASPEPNNNHKNVDDKIISTSNKSIRSSSPSGGTLIVKETEPVKTSLSQPIIKSSLLPLNSMLGKIKSNVMNYARRDSKSPNKTYECHDDFGEYVTITDIKNNNNGLNKSNDIYSKPVKAIPTPLPEDKKEVQYVSLNELPANESKLAAMDSLERKKRQGARVTLDAEGKVVYSSDSLSRRKTAHSTFEPGPFVKTVTSPQSPGPARRNQTSVRPIQQTQKQRITSNVPVTEFNRPLSPQPGKFVIKAVHGATSPTSEIVRMPPATIVAPTTRPMSPKSNSRGAYVYIQDSGHTRTPAQDKGRVSSPPSVQRKQFSPGTESQDINEMYAERIREEDLNRRHMINSSYYSPLYHTILPQEVQYRRADLSPERSITPDITRGLDRPDGRNMFLSKNVQQPLPYSTFTSHDPVQMNRRMGIPVEIPQVNYQKHHNYYYEQPGVPEINPHRVLEFRSDQLKISPIDPRNSGEFKTSTPSGKSSQGLKAAVNLENQMFSPKKSTMSNDELYAIIHKSKKKLNIDDDQSEDLKIKNPESDKLEPIVLNKQSQKDSIKTSNTCEDRKGNQQTSRLDFKRLLLQKSNVLLGNSKKISAVEQLKISKELIKTPPKSNNPEMNILDLSGSPRTYVNRKFNSPKSPRHMPEKPKPQLKVMSPRSQWRFANPRSDVLSSTILEDCREDENSNNSSESLKNEETKTYPIVQKSEADKENSQVDKKRYASVTDRLRAQRAKFFDVDNKSNSKTVNDPSNYSVNEDKSTIPPTLETSF